MKCSLFVLLFFSAIHVSTAQYTYVIKADSVTLTSCDSSELIVENHTQGVPGFLYNTGHGRTAFKRGLVKINDSLYLIGADTLNLRKGFSNPWVQGGNSFGTTGVLGTLDNNHLDLYTNNTRRARWTNTGHLLLGTTTDNGNALQVNGNISNHSFTISSTANSITCDTNYGDFNLHIGTGYLIGIRNTHIGVGDGGGIVSGSDNVMIGSAVQNYLYGNNSNNVIIGSNQRWVGGNTSTINNSIVLGHTFYNLPGNYNNSLFINGEQTVFNSTVNAGIAISGGVFRSNTFCVGGKAGNEITEVYFGNNLNSWADGVDYSIIGSQARFGDTASLRGGSLSLLGGKPNSRGKSGDVIFGFRDTSGATVEVARIHNNRFVGIGTASPAAQLHTTGTVRFAGLTNDTTQTRVVVSDASGNLFYRTENSWTENGVMNSSRAVNGTLSAKKLRLPVEQWADYVFEDDYSLPSLDSLKKYVSQYRHLPGIPSASQAGKEGIDVAQHEAALLKKIEELTLYAIEQDKTAQMQNEKIMKLSEGLQALQQELTGLKTMIRK